MAGAIAAGIIGLLLALTLYLRTDWRKGFAPAILLAFVPLSVLNGTTTFRHLHRLKAGESSDWQSNRK
jgi:hypothetical protein